MRTVLGLAASLLSVIAAGPATAADVSGSVGVVSDYRYRGLSLSQSNPALQATLDVDLGKGASSSFWFSTIREQGQTSTELEADVGKQFDLTSSMSIDLSATYYLYPSRLVDSYAEATAVWSATRGAITGELGISFAPAQRAMRDETGARRGNAYCFARASLSVPRTPVRLLAQAGYERGAFVRAAQEGKWDWNLGALVESKSLLLGLTYVDSDVSAPKLVGSAAIKF